MATAKTTDQASPIGTKLYTLTETSTDASSVQMDSSSGTLFQIEIDNTANSVASYLNLYDVAGGGVATVGTTDEDFVFMAPAATRVTYSCPNGAVYAAGLHGAVVSTPGSATGPRSTVVAYILVNT